MILSLGLVEVSKLERLDGDRAADVPGVLKKAPGAFMGSNTVVLCSIE